LEQFHGKTVREKPGSECQRHRTGDDTPLEQSGHALSAATYSVAENGGSFTVTVNRTNGSSPSSFYFDAAAFVLRCKKAGLPSHGSKRFW
jgi:hypothetical protein